MSDRLSGFDERVSELLTQVEDLAHGSNHEAMALLHCALYSLGRSMGLAKTAEQNGCWNALSQFMFRELNQAALWNEGRGIRAGSGGSPRV